MGDQHRPSGLESILKDPCPSDDAISNQQNRDAFHAKYLREVGEALGFKRDPRRTRPISGSERRVFDKIYEAFLKERRLRNGFGAYSRFFNAFFVEPYGFRFQQGKYEDALSLDARGAQEGVADDDKQEIQQFARRINLPALLYRCLLRDEAFSHSPVGKPLSGSISYSRDGNAKGYDLTANLARSVWDILLGDISDCTSIRITKGGSNNEVPVVKFGKYWFASLLHHIHPHLNYLVINATGPDLPSPLFRIKMMDGVDEQGEKYLIVGGVLGESFDRFKESNIGEVIENIIIEFFRREGKEGSIFYNLSHSDNPAETCNQFTDHLQHTSKFKHESSEVIKVIDDKKREGVKHECTHKMRVPGTIRNLEGISNFGEEGKKRLFSGEQYSETFYPNNDPGMPGAFNSLDGFVKGLVFSPPEESKADAETKPKKMSFLKRLAIGGLAALGLAAGYLAFHYIDGKTDSPRAAIADAGVEAIANEIDDPFGGNHEYWWVGSYVDRESGKPGFGPHSHDSQSGNAQPIMSDAGDGGSQDAGAGDIGDSIDTALPPTPVCSEVLQDPAWPTGTRIAKRLDFDGDGKSDIVIWREGEFNIDLSGQDGFGKWDLRVNYRQLDGEHFWPFVEDLNSDGREDFVLYVPDTGTWYVKLMKSHLRGSVFIPRWDWIIPDGAGSACKAHLDIDPKKSVYSRPLPGDYNGDGWVDLAVVCSDGVWRIDHGGGGCGAFGSIDEEVRFLDETRLAQAPGWAYIPVFDEVDGGRRVMAYKIPDGLPNAGQLVIVKAYGTDLSGMLPTPLGGNSSIIVPGRHAGPSSGLLSLVTSKGWSTSSLDGNIVSVDPGGIFKYPRCLPVLGDFDGDNVDDAAAYCGDEWRIMNSSTRQEPDGVARIYLGLLQNKDYLPGVVFFGGLSYGYAQQLMEYYGELHPGVARPIPVDMGRAIGGGISFF